jgi:hypothetical protein
MSRPTQRFRSARQPSKRESFNFYFSHLMPKYAALLLEEQRFAIAIDLIKSRSDLVLNQVFTRMAAAGIPVRQSLAVQDVERILGVDLTHKLKVITAAIFTNVDQDVASLKELHDSLRRAMNSMYPKRKVLQILFDVPVR